MTSSLHVIEPGLLATVQDLGRVGWQRFGIPVSGATDPIALRAANVLVGNPQGAAGLEIAMLGPCLEVEAESVCVAVAGGSTVMTVEPKDGGEVRRIAPLESVTLARGDRFRVGAVSGTAVAYLAVAGGFALEPFLGSLSTYVRGGFGGLEGRALRAGDELPLTLHQAPAREDMRLDRLDLAPAKTVRVVLGPQDDYFTPEALNAFFGTDWTVTRDADRMGLRLDGPTLTHARGANIVSDGIAPGAIQVPGNGLPIVLLADRQTTGGYPKIATVISADLPALGRVTPGTRLRFERISLEQAEAARAALEARMRSLAGELLPARKGSIDLGLLMSANLISGVTDGSTMK